MAKKVVASPDDEEESGGKKKKKRSWCCTCCLVLLVISFVFNAAILGVGWFFGDKYSKEYLNMSLGDVFGVVNGLYWTNDDFIKNPYDKNKDLDGFYGEIKKNVLLKTDAPIDFSSALEKAVEDYLINGEAKSASVIRRLAENGDGEFDESGDGEEGSDSNIFGILLDTVAGVFTRENIDIDKLKAYSEINDEYKLSLKDRQLAAFVQSVIDVVLKNADKLDSFAQYADIIDFKKIVALKQITFKNVSKPNELGENIVTATTADVTVWIALQDTAGQALTYYTQQNGYGWASGLARFLGNVLLPKNLYVTLTIPLRGEADVQVTLNDMSSDKRDRVYALINALMPLIGGGSGDDQTVQAMLNGIGDQIKPYLEMLSGADDNIFTDGALNIDLIDMLAKMASDGMEPEEALTKPDFMYLLQAVLTSSAEARRADIKQYVFDGWYTSPDGRLVYKPADTTGYTAVKYDRKFVQEIENKYSLNFGDDADMNDVMQSLGMSQGGDSASGMNVDDLLDKIHKERFNASLKVDDVSTLDLTITDKMLAAALATQLDDLLGDAMGDMQIALDALSFVTRDDAPGRTFALVAVTADISGMLGGLGGDSMLMSLASNVLPAELMLSVWVDITRNSAEADYVPVKFMLNDYENTDKVLDTLAKLAPSLDLKEATGGIEDALRNMLDTLDDTVGIRVQPSVKLDNGTFTSGAIVMPNLFELVSRMVLKDEATGESVLSASELQGVLRGLIDTDDVDKTSNLADNYKHFISDVVDKYYLNVDPDDIEDFQGLTSKISGGNGFDASKFRVGKEANGDPNRAYLIDDTRDADELSPVMSAGELGALIKNNMTGDNVQSFGIHRVETTANTLSITLSVRVGEMLPSEVRKLMDLDTIYAVATVHLDETVTTAGGDIAYKVEFNLNTMSKSQLDDTLRLVEFFADSFDIKAQVDEIGAIMYEQLGSLSSGFGGEGDDGIGGEFFSFTNDGLKLQGFYEFLSNNISALKTGNVDPEHVKAAIQGMFDRKTVNNKYNYVLNDFIVNPSNVQSASPSGRMTDNQFNGFFQSAMVAGQMSTVTAMQTIVLAKTDNNSYATSVRNWINAHVKSKPASIEKDMIVATFRLVIDKNGDNASNADDFIPDYIYATAVLEKTRTDDKDSFASVGVVFNNMAPEAYSVVLKLMGMSEDTTDDGKININSVVNQCVSSLSNLTNLMNVNLYAHDRASAGDTSVGEIEFVSKIPGIG